MVHCSPYWHDHAASHTENKYFQMRQVHGASRLFWIPVLRNAAKFCWTVCLYFRGFCLRCSWYSLLQIMWTDSLVSRIRFAPQQLVLPFFPNVCLMNLTVSVSLCSQLFHVSSSWFNSFKNSMPCQSCDMEDRPHLTARAWAKPRRSTGCFPSQVAALLKQGQKHC